MPQEIEDKMDTRPSLADRLSTALEASRQTVANLNEAIVGKSKTPDELPPTEEVPAHACPNAGKSV